MPIIEKSSPAQERANETDGVSWHPRQRANWIIVGIALLAGLWLRHWAWETTTTLRAPKDISNAYRWGTIARDTAVGFSNLYARVGQDLHRGDAYELDYPPLRLAVVYLWVAWTQAKFPGVTQWQPDYSFNAPLLWLNTFLELSAAVAAFLLVRQALDQKPREASCWPLGALSAALLFWFNPALIWDAHCWPQWECWPLPFFFFAALACLKNRWTLAGVLLAIGALLKGQILLVVPVFILWPLFKGSVVQAARLVGGFIVAVLVVVLPFFHHDLAWLRVGYLFGSTHHLQMHIGQTPNLASILDLRLGWTRPTRILFNLGGLKISIRLALLLFYALLLLLCAVGAASLTARTSTQVSVGIPQRTHDHARILAALTAPWVLMFAVLPQMHERYLVFGAAATAIVAPLGFVPLLAHLLLSALSLLAMLQALPGEGLHRFLQRFEFLYPDSGWIVLFCAAVLLWYALVPTRRALVSAKEQPA